MVIEEVGVGLVDDEQYLLGSSTKRGPAGHVVAVEHQANQLFFQSRDQILRQMCIYAIFQRGVV